MTEVLAHTISMLRGRNGSNSSRNLKWDALDTLPPVCPPAYMQTTYSLCYIHTYIQTTCTLTYIHAGYIYIPCATYMQIAGQRYLCQIHTVGWCSASACKLLQTIFNVEQNLQTAQERMLEANNFVDNVHCGQQFSMQSKSCKQLNKGGVGGLKALACKQLC